MSAEAAIYPTSNSVSNRFFQNFLTQRRTKEEPRTGELAASKETTKPCQAILSKKVLPDFFASTSEFLRTLPSLRLGGRF